MKVKIWGNTEGRCIYAKYYPDWDVATCKINTKSCIMTVNPPEECPYYYNEEMKRNEAMSNV